MNLNAIAKSLSNSLRFGFGSKKHLNGQPTEQESNPTVTSIASDSVEEIIPTQSSLNKTVTQISQHRLSYKQTVEQILQKVSELEHTLYEDQQQEFKLRMAVEHQTERIDELNFSLDTEKQRNERLVQLLRGMDTDCSSDEVETGTQLLNGMHIQSKSDLFGSISPLLMQQRYDELCVSHRQTHRQLAKKEKAMKLLQCDFEELRGKYDSMYDDYRNEQRRLEALCARYLYMQRKKKQQICALKETLGFASECILHAQLAIECCDTKHLTSFNTNLEFFMRALRNCCCARKLQQLQQLHGVDIDEELLDIALPQAPSVGRELNSATKALTSSQRRLSKRCKHSKCFE